MAVAVATVAATKTARTALLAGATGLVGRELLGLLLADPRYSAVHCVGRRAPAVAHAKLVNHVIDFSNVAQLAALPHCDDIYIALGTTIKVAGSQAAFKAIDHDAVIALAHAQLRIAAAQSVNNNQRIGVVSAMGADAISSVFYNRTKGQMEAAISALGYASVGIARPSLLSGDRAALHQAARVGEQLGLLLMNATRFFIPADYKAIAATDVAKALHRLVTASHSGTRIALSSQLREMAAT